MGELGLRGNFRERVWEPLQAFRSQSSSDISLIEFMQTRALGDGMQPVGMVLHGNPVTMEDVWVDLGLDPTQTTLNQLLSMSDDVKYLAPEIVREFIVKGFDTEATHLDLVAGTENADQMTVTSPWIEYKNVEPVETGEAETIAEATVEWGAKTISIKKKAIALKLTDELVLSVKLPILSYFLQRVGVMHAAGFYKEGVQTLINGDQADASDACTVIGVADQTTNKMTFADYLVPWIRARLIGMRWDNLVTSEVMARKILQFDEFSKPQGLGGLVTEVKTRNQVIPTMMPHMISSNIDDNYNLLFDKRFAMLFLVFRPLMVESQRIVMRQLNGTAVSMIAGYQTIEPAARIIVDEDVAFSANGFPSWMDPIV